MLDSCITNYFPHDKNLLLWVTAISESGQTYYIVSDVNRNEYSLWKGSKPTRYKSENPEELNGYIK